MTDDTKLPLTSDNPTEALLAQLREQAPHVFSEGKVDWDKHGSSSRQRLPGEE